MMATLLGQIIVMALLMGGGAVLKKRGMLSEQSSRELGSILVNVIIPCVILKSYMVEFSLEQAKSLALSAGLSLLSLVVAMGISYAAFGSRHGILNFASAFGNAGFMGIPLAQALFGEQAVFYIAAYVALLNLFQWTYGLYVMTGDKAVIRPTVILRNPVLLSILFGVILFLLPVHYPDVLVKVLGHITAMNTPVAMVVLGTYLAEMDWKQFHYTHGLLLCMALRLAIIPSVTLGLFRFLPVDNTVMLMTLLIASATSVGGNIAIFARQQGTDYLLSVTAVCLSTILSLATLPVFLCLAQSLLGR